ncbi:FliM/FliN family flagellar motor switch protein [Novilysobacter erysipheiresistens]|uniref:Flagellar motor switch protein FliN n=1 Tax=Novilysobacter erysipheiresistens TaxID=1749332 RepID=A0ABU7Z0F4_9GAMM
MKGNLLRDVTANEPDAPGEAITSKDISLIGHVQVSLAAQVGTVTMSIDRLFGLKEGEVVSMNELLEAPMTLMLNGRAVARGELLAVDDHFGVRILELA